MADLTESQAAGITKIVGSDATGVEQTPVQSTAAGAVHVNLRAVSGVEVLPALEATQVIQNTNIGATNESAAASDTSTSGLNGLLKRIAQRVTSLIGVFNPLDTPPTSSASGLVVRPINPEYPTFSVVATAIVVGNNKSMLAIQNTGTSVVRIREVWIINDRNTAVTGVVGTFNVFRIASFTAGTALTPASYDTADTLPAGITAATGSTVATETTLLRTGKWSTDDWGPGTTDTESFDHAIQNTEPFWKQTPNGKALAIRQNQGLHVKFSTNSAAGAFNIRLVFTTE